MKRSPLHKAKGRYQPGERFALVPRQVLESAAFGALPDFAKVALLALAGQYRGAGNGDISLTWPEARALGVSQEWKLRAGIKLAERAGLCEITRPGGNVAGGEKLPTLYALGWLPIEPSDKFANPPGTMLKAPNRWATWTRPDDWSAQIETEKRKAQGKRIGHHTREGQSAPPVRGDHGHPRYTREGQSSQSTATHEGETSRDLGREAENRALRLIHAQPHLSDFDVAKAVGWKVGPYRIRTLRESAHTAVRSENATA